MYEIDAYLEAHSRYVEALAAVDAIGTLLRDVGDQLLASPLNVRFDKDRVTLSGRVNGRGGGPGNESVWPTLEQIHKALEHFESANQVLVEQGERLVDARAPDALKAALAPND